MCYGMCPTQTGFVFPDMGDRLGDEGVITLERIQKLANKCTLVEIPRGGLLGAVKSCAEVLSPLGFRPTALAEGRAALVSRNSKHTGAATANLRGRPK